jgi:basic membrane protein A
VKKTLLVVSALVVLLVAAGFGGSANRPAQKSATFKVGLVTDIGGLNDRGFNHLAFVGLQRAEKRLGVSGRVVESRSSQEYIPNLGALARAGYGLVIGVGFTEIQAMGEVANRFPKSHFAIVDVSYKDLKNKPKNVEGLLFHEEQVGYLAGYAAALAAKARGANTVSSVGGQKQPPVDRFIAGYQAGAQKAVPGIKTVNAYSQDFSNPAKCKEIALNQISQGSVVVFAVAGGCGLGVIDAAGEKKVWAVGVDADQSYLGPQVLTSATKGVDTAVYLSIRDAEANKFKGGHDAVYGLGQKGVGLGKFSKNTPKGIEQKVKLIEAQIKSGKIKNIPTVVK